MEPTPGTINPIPSSVFRFSVAAIDDVVNDIGITAHTSKRDSWMVLVSAGNDYTSDIVRATWIPV